MTFFSFQGATIYKFPFGDVCVCDDDNDDDDGCVFLK